MEGARIDPRFLMGLRAADPEVSRQHAVDVERRRRLDLEDAQQRIPVLVRSPEIQALVRQIEQQRNTGEK